MEKEPIREVNPEIDTTRFVNVDVKSFDIYIGGKIARHLEAGEEDIMPVWVAQVGSKHLVDRVLQEKGIKDTNTPSPARDALLAQILPDIASQENIIPPTEEDFKNIVEERLAKQDELIEGMGGTIKSKSGEIQGLKMQLGRLQKALERATSKDKGQE